MMRFELLFVKKIISPEYLKIPKYNLYNFPTHTLKEKSFNNEICTYPHYLIFIFIKLNSNIISNNYLV
jgi:hypothetical protein